MDQFSTPVLLHEEAVYLHEGAQYHVDRLDWDEKKAYVRPVEVDYYTDALASVTVQVLDTFAGPDAEPVARHHGEVKVTVAREHVQEDPVPHAREHRLGADPPARADAAHHRRTG